MAYRLALPPFFQGIHELFHVFDLRKYVHDPEHINGYVSLQIKENLTFVVEPLCTKKGEKRR